LNSEAIEDLVQDLFLRAYEKADTFSCDVEADKTRQARMVRAWLGAITRNLAHDRFRNEPMLELPGDEFLETCEAPKAPDFQSSNTEHVVFMTRALNTLDDREQDVLRTTAEWYSPGARQQRLPHSVMTALASRCNTSPSNIRQIRLRAIGKLRKIMEQRADAS
jgi:RNA polymerase sigma factor (sigma-70 family)